LKDEATLHAGQVSLHCDAPSLGMKELRDLLRRDKACELGTGDKDDLRRRDHTWEACPAPTSSRRKAPGAMTRSSLSDPAKCLYAHTQPKRTKNTCEREYAIEHKLRAMA